MEPEEIRLDFVFEPEACHKKTMDDRMQAFLQFLQEQKLAHEKANKGAKTYREEWSERRQRQIRAQLFHVLCFGAVLVGSWYWSKMKM